MSRRTAESHIAVLLPAVRVQGEKGKQIDGGLEYIEAVAGTDPVETAPRITALYVAPVAFALGIEPPLVGMTGNAAFIESDEHGVVMLMTYDLMHSNQAGAYEPKVTFGEYGAPDFDSRVQTIASAATASVMSVEAQVDELWGASKDDDWKRAEVQRILTERGIEDTPEPGIVESLPAGQDTDIPGNDAV